jgi:hypothetical protein
MPSDLVRTPARPIGRDLLQQHQTALRARLPIAAWNNAHDETGPRSICCTRADLAADDLAEIVDISGLGVASACGIDGGEATVVQQKTLEVVEDIAAGIHALPLSGSPGRGWCWTLSHGRCRLRCGPRRHRTGHHERCDHHIGPLGDLRKPYSPPYLRRRRQRARRALPCFGSARHVSTRSRASMRRRRSGRDR